MRNIKTQRRPEIVAAAIAQAEEFGLASLSTRSVARRLDVTPMALYGYFPNKEAILDAMVEELLSDFPAPPADLGWQEQLLTLGWHARGVAKRFPATFPLLFTRPAVSPHGLRVVDLIYRALLDAGFDRSEVPRLERMMSTFVLGFAVSEVSGRFSAGTRDPAGRRALLPADALPAHQTLAEDLTRTVDWDAEFRADLEDLVAVLAATRRGPVKDRPRSSS